MAQIIKFFNDFQMMLDKDGDPRTAKWPLMSSPFPTLAICFSYVYIVKVLGPKIMENRKPMELRKVLVYYNLLQVLFSVWLFFEIGMSGWLTGRYSFQCEPVDYSNHPITIRFHQIYGHLQRCSTLSLKTEAKGSGMKRSLNGIKSPDSMLNSSGDACVSACTAVQRINDRAPEEMFLLSVLATTRRQMVHACWWYYFSKFTEFMDTIFFVLRKKNEHVSTLHVIHHGVMPISVWFGVKFTPGGHSTFFGFINTFVHIVMYTYYLLSAMGPKYQKFLWWKKYLTTFQMVQFIVIMVHAFQLLFIDCNYPRGFVWFIGMHAVMFFFLFNEFYKQTYKQRGKSVSSKILSQKTVNGSTTASTNGSLSNGHTTDSAKSNGHITNGYTNGRAADYYVTASSADLHHRPTAAQDIK